MKYKQSQPHYKTHNHNTSYTTSYKNQNSRATSVASDSLPSISKEPIMHINATPDNEYPLRILKAYRENCDCKWSSDLENAVVKLMNDDQEKRAKILDAAIKVLEKHLLKAIKVEEK